MRLLLDTHAFLWFVANDSQLSTTARDLIRSGGNELWYSTASLWEIAIKLNLGKLKLGGPFPDFIEQQLDGNRVQVLPITLAHLSVVSQLALHHRDPFDRLIIAQAIAEDLPVISIDQKFDSYPVKRIW